MYARVVMSWTEPGTRPSSASEASNVTSASSWAAAIGSAITAQGSPITTGCGGAPPAAGSRHSNP
jgi:hypothetical protein